MYLLWRDVYSRPLVIFFLNVIVLLQLFTIYFWLCWVFVAVRRLFPSCRERGVLSSSGARASHCGGFSCCRVQALGAQASVVTARGLGHAGSVAVAHRPSCLVACEIFPDQGSNLCPPSLAGGLPTTAPPGMVCSCFNWVVFLLLRVLIYSIYCPLSPQNTFF